MSQILTLDASSFNGYVTRDELASFSANDRKYGRIQLMQLTRTTTGRVEYELVIGGLALDRLINFYTAVELFNKVEHYLGNDDFDGLKAKVADKASLEPRIQTSI